MKIQTLIAGLVLLATSLSSHAGIVYEWKGVKKESPSMFSMSIEFDEATVKQGGFSFHAELGKIYPKSGLISFNMPHSSYQPRTDPFNNGMDFGYFEIDVGFAEGKFLTGSIRLFDFQTRLNMSTGPSRSSEGRLFTIYDTDADYGMGDCAGPTAITCQGGTGHVREVPEPASIALFGLGALTACGVRRRRTAWKAVPRTQHD